MKFEWENNKTASTAMAMDKHLKSALQAIIFQSLASGC